MNTAAPVQLESMEMLVPPALVVQLEVTVGSPAELGPAVSEAFRNLAAFIALNGLSAAGRPRAIYTTWGDGGIRFTAAIPIGTVPPTVVESARVTINAVPETKALRFVHHGPYRDIAATYGRIEQWLRERGGITTAADWAHYAPMWEEYPTDPATTPESELVTWIYLTLR